MSSQWMKRWFPHLPGALDRAPMAGLMCAARCFWEWLWPEQDPRFPARTILLPRNRSRIRPQRWPLIFPKKPLRFHEDAELIEQNGQFSISGDRVIFIAVESQNRFIGLENLVLQGVAEKIADNPAQQSWTVSGKVTEYRGTNYLILTRATSIPTPASGVERVRKSSVWWHAHACRGHVSASFSDSHAHDKRGHATD